jgi:NAD(P)-dependent dehydrogenase (short-subunit alcohol dehydrogenase family)
MSGPRAIAIIGRGTPFDRALAVACAEGGCAVALGTVEHSQEQEFACASIANEVWSIGKEQFVRVMDAGDVTAVTSFADEVWDRLGGCSVLVVNSYRPSAAPLDELSADEWDEIVRSDLTIPFLALQAFARLMERQGGGMLVALAPASGEDDASILATRTGMETITAEMERHWAGHGVHAFLLEAANALDPESGPAAILELCEGS